MLRAAQEGIRLLLEIFDQALADYDAVLAVRPDLAETWTNRGATLSEMGRAGEALESLDRALLLQPGMVAALTVVVPVPVV